MPAQRGDCLHYAGVKAIKLYAWEVPFRQRIEVLRAAELHEIRCAATKPGRRPVIIPP